MYMESDRGLTFQLVAFSIHHSLNRREVGVQMEWVKITIKTAPKRCKTHQCLQGGPTGKEGKIALAHRRPLAYILRAYVATNHMTGVVKKTNITNTLQTHNIMQAVQYSTVNLCSDKNFKLIIEELQVVP